MDGHSLHEKVCTKCDVLKPRTAEYFHRSKGMLDGLRNNCKTCQNDDRKRRYDKDPERKRAQSREWRRRNKDRCRENQRDWLRRNPHKIKEYNQRHGPKVKARDPKGFLEKQRARSRKWREANYDHAIEKERARRNRNKESSKAATLRWRANNPDKIEAMRRRRVKREAARRSSDPGYRLSHNMRVYISRSLSSNEETGAFRLLPYTRKQLNEHLEKQFQPGMSWDNYGDVWNVDHIRPVSSFSFEKSTDPGFQECWALANLRPIHCSENFSKGAQKVFLI